MPLYDRVLTLQTPVRTRDTLGGEVTTWATIAELWGNVHTRGQSAERYISSAEREWAARVAAVRIPWRQNVNETMRIVYDGYAWDITGIAEIGFRRELEIYCETDVGRLVTAEAITLRGGLSADDIPEIAEVTITSTDNELVFEAFTSMRVLILRLESQPDLTALVLADDPTELNQLGAFTKWANTLTIDGEVWSVWISNQVLTFAEERTFEAA